jgi:hypothetical protein
MNYDEKFLTNPLRAARKYPLSLGDGPTGYQKYLEPEPLDSERISHVNRIQERDLAGTKFRHPLSGLTVFDWGTVPSRGVERVSLDLWETSPTSFSTQTKRHSLELSYVKVDETEAESNGFDAYFLPWDQTGGVVYMELGADADIFFTAALSGCSVMVSGDPTEPTVYHCGITQWSTQPYCIVGKGKYGNPAPKGKEGIEIWEDLVAFVTKKDAPPAERIDRTYYAYDFEENQPPYTTRGSREIEAELRRKKRDPKASAIPWGAVFGIRDHGTGKWTFYLQQNVTFNYTIPDQRPASKARPLVVSEFYPNERNFARLWEKL